MKTTKQHPDRNRRESNSVVSLNGSLLVVIFFLLGTASVLVASSSPPSGIGYQGYLVDSSGDPLADDAPANFLIEFRIYDAETGGAAKYAEVQTVTVDNGAFSVLIGEGTEITGEESLKLSDIAEVFDADDASDRYVEITVEGGSAIAPRLRLLTSPYAFLASKAIRAETVGDASTSALSFSGDEIEIDSDLQVTGTGLFQTGGTKLKHPIYVYHSAANLSTHHLYIDENEIQAHGSGGESDHSRTLHLNNDGGNLGLSASGYTTTVNGDFSISGDLTSNLVVDGTVTANSDTTLNGSATVNGDTTISGSNELTVGGASSLEGGLTVSGGSDTDLDDWRLRVSGSGSDAMHLDSNEIQAVNSEGNATTLYLNHNGGNVAVDGGGRVGIGTNSPSVPLHVASANSYSFGRTARYGNSSNSTDDNVSPSTAILAKGAVVVDNGGDGVYIVSDERIKDIQARVQAADSLARVMNLKVTDYKMRDAVRFGDSLHLGLIAQELETVIPRAVSRGVGFLPDIYSFATQAHLDSESAQLTLRLKGDHNLKEGQVLRLIVGTTQIDRSVVALPDSASFVVDDWEHDTEEVFVFGRQVDDFRTVNYDHVLLHGLAALQEVNRRLETSNQELQARLALADQRNQEFGRMLASMNERIKSLEGVVASSEESGKDLVANFRD